MLFSAFARFGHFRFTGKPPVGQVIYRSLREALGAGENLGEDTFTGPMAGKLFATAMALSNVQRTIDRVNRERIPHTAEQMLEQHEGDYRITPPAASTRDDRRATLAVAERLGLGCQPDVLQTALSELLGADLIAIRQPDDTEYVVWPSNWDTTGPGLWKRPDLVAKWFALTASVAPGLATLAVEQIGPTTEPLRGGEEVIIDPGILGIEERVTLAAVGSAVTATFARAHDVGAIVTTEPWPVAASSSRHLLIVVTPTISRSRAWRKRSAGVLNKILRAVDRYSLVEEYSPGVLGPFIPGEGIPGITPLVEIPTVPS